MRDLCASRLGVSQTEYIQTGEFAMGPKRKKYVMHVNKALTLMQLVSWHFRDQSAKRKHVLTK